MNPPTKNQMNDVTRYIMPISLASVVRSNRPIAEPLTARRTGQGRVTIGFGATVVTNGLLCRWNSCGCVTAVLPRPQNSPLRDARAGAGSIAAPAPITIGFRTQPATARNGRHSNTRDQREDDAGARAVASRAAAAAHAVPAVALALLAAAFVATLPAAAAPLFLSSARNAALNHQIVQACPWIAGAHLTGQLGYSAPLPAGARRRPARPGSPRYRRRQDGEPAPRPG